MGTQRVLQSPHNPTFYVRRQHKALLLADLQAGRQTGRAAGQVMSLECATRAAARHKAPHHASRAPCP